MFKFSKCVSSGLYCKCVQCMFHLHFIIYEIFFQHLDIWTPNYDISISEKVNLFLCPDYAKERLYAPGHQLSQLQRSAGDHWPRQDHSVLLQYPRHSPYPNPDHNKLQLLQLHPQRSRPGLPVRRQRRRRQHSIHTQISRQNVPRGAKHSTLPRLIETALCPECLTAIRPATCKGSSDGRRPCSPMENPGSPWSRPDRPRTSLGESCSVTIVMWWSVTGLSLTRLSIGWTRRTLLI